MQTALNTRTSVETRLLLNAYIEESGRKIAEVVEEALKEYIAKRKPSNMREVNYL